MAQQKITQRKFVKGVNAAAQTYAQPPGSIPRISNLMFETRGALTTANGSMLIAQGRPRTLFGAFPGSTPFPPITEVVLYQPLGKPQKYYLIWKDSFVLGVAGTPVPTDAGAGGLLSAGTYQWRVTSVDNLGGESQPSGVGSLLLVANHKASLTWTSVDGAAGYNLYRTIANGATFLLVNTTGPITTNSFLDNVPDVSLGTKQPPTGPSTALASMFMYVDPTTLQFNYNTASLVKVFPADMLTPEDGTPGGIGGGGGGGGGTPSGGNNPPTISGGVVGNMSPLPQIVQFTDLMILALGNGIAPYQSDGTTGGTVPLTNTFTATYPAWQATQAYLVGDLIHNTAVTFIFKAIQNGTSGGAAPAFPTGLNQTVADGGVIWQNIGPIVPLTAPRGAAHAIVYAGSLWLLNTSPTNSADGIDGPSCLKMSDLNNPTSWNPLNVAFLDKDDGTQGMGLATYTLAEAGIPPTGSLVAFKEFSTFQINGVFGASNFSIQRAQTDMGCIAPRTIQFVPGFGIMRMTHLGIAVFDGVRDHVISEEIRPYLFGSEDDLFGGRADIVGIDWNYIWFSKGAQAADPPVYLMAAPLRAALTSTLTNVSASAQPLTSGTALPPGTYYVLPAVVDINGNTNTAPEIGPIVVGANQEIVVTFGTVPTGTVLLRAWFGTTPGGENLFTEYIPGGLNNVIITGDVRLTSPASSKPGVPSAAGAGALNRIFAYDLVLKCWSIIDLPWPISALKQIRSAGTIPITVGAGYNDGALRRMVSDDATWDVDVYNNDPIIHWSFETPEVFGKAASDRVYFRRLSLRGRGIPTGLAAIITTNGLDGPSTQTQNFTVLLFGNQEFVAYVDINVTCLNAHATINGSGIVEIDSVDWSAVPKPAAALVVAG